MRTFTSFARAILLATALALLSGSVVVAGAAREELKARMGADDEREPSINPQNPPVLDARISILPGGADEEMLHTGSDLWGAVFDAHDSGRTAADAPTGGAGFSAGGFGTESVSFAADAREPSLAIPLPPALLAAPVLAVAAELARRRMVRRRQ